MNRSLYLSFLFILLVPSVVCSEEMGIMRLSFIEGTVQIITQDNSEWAPASINMPLDEGDRLWVSENSRLEIQVQGGVYVRADEKTSLDIISLGGDAMQLYLDHGHLSINNRRGGIQIVQVDTPLSSIRSYDNSIMMIDIHEDGTTEVEALKGYLYAENREGKTRIASGNALTIRPDGTADLAPIGPPDEWERWNRERDRQLEVWGESSRYLPDPLHDYSYDLDQNGAWIYVSEFGYIWNPRITTVEWVPYREGHWKWIRGQYVWISDEPWGWAPYHYGRWTHVIGTGWCWAPPLIGDIFWGPGYVGWVTMPDYIGWIPLAPGEPYYGKGYYGPKSVDITKVDVKTLVVPPFKNAQIPSSLIAVKRDTFGMPRPMPVLPGGNPFLKHRDGFLPPAMKPERPLPVSERPIAIAPTPFLKQPPERIKRTMPAEIKIQRKLVRERDSSVFIPGPPKPLPFRQMKEPKVVNRRIPPPERPERREGPQKRERE